MAISANGTTEMPGGSFLNLSTEDLDSHVYRIMKQEHVFALFKRRENSLSQMRIWKDKFENFQLCLGGYFNGQPFDYSFKDDFVGQCWTMDGFSEAMWGIYASDAQKRYLRIRSTPRLLLHSLAAAHPNAPEDTCFVGKVEYKFTEQLAEYARDSNVLRADARSFAKALLLKRRAFSHESEVRLLYFGNAGECSETGHYCYAVDPYSMITQIMADPNRDRSQWGIDKELIRGETNFRGEIKRSKIYDPPEWDPRTFV